MEDLRGERLAVLRMVAAGTVGPEEALELLDALLPLGGAPAAEADRVVPLRVHFELDGREMDFALPADPVATLGEVLGEALGMLPSEARGYVPEGLLHSGSPVGRASDDRLVCLEDGDFALKIIRQRFRFEFGGRGKGFAHHG